MFTDPPNAHMSDEEPQATMMDQAEADHIIANSLSKVLPPYHTESVQKVVLQESISAQIRQLFLHYC